MTGGNGRLAVNFGGLDGLAGEIAAAVSAIQARIDRLDQDLTPLKNDWGGEASTSYQTAQLKWNTALTDLKTTLQQTGTAVTDSGADYLRVENAAKTSFGG